VASYYVYVFRYNRGGVEYGVAKTIASAEGDVAAKIRRRPRAKLHIQEPGKPPKLTFRRAERPRAPLQGPSTRPMQGRPPLPRLPLEECLRMLKINPPGIYVMSRFYAEDDDCRVR
jgi:hypothetical protein